MRRILPVSLLIYKDDKTCKYNAVTYFDVDRTQFGYMRYLEFERIVKKLKTAECKVDIIGYTRDEINTYEKVKNKLACLEYGVGVIEEEDLDESEYPTLNDEIKCLIHEKGNDVAYIITKGLNIAGIIADPKKQVHDWHWDEEHIMKYYDAIDIGIAIKNNNKIDNMALLSGKIKTRTQLDFNKESELIINIAGRTDNMDLVIPYGYQHVYINNENKGNNIIIKDLYLGNSIHCLPEIIVNNDERVKLVCNNIIFCDGAYSIEDINSSSISERIIVKNEYKLPKTMGSIDDFFKLDIRNWGKEVLDTGDYVVQVLFEQYGDEDNTLKSIILGKNCINIAVGSFADFKSIERIVIKSKLCVIKNGVFGSLSNLREFAVRRDADLIIEDEALKDVLRSGRCEIKYIE